MFQQTTKHTTFVICALRVNTFEVQDFDEMHARLPGPKSLLILFQIIHCK